MWKGWWRRGGAGWYRERYHWKIENEDINALKTKGYHFEHLMLFMLTWLKLKDPYG
jgi:hypothetical protein